MENYNDEIIATARKYVGKSKGQCKVFVQKVIHEATGIFVPRNHPDVARKYEWLDADKNPQIQAVTLGAITVVQPGMAFQILWKPEAVKSKYHWHTLIYLGRDEEGNIKCIDSNWLGKEKVREHKIPKSWWNKSFDKGTAYTILKAQE